MHHLIPLDIEYKYDGNLIYEIDINGIITYANSAFAKVSGFRKEELIGKNHKIFKHPDVPDKIYNRLWTIDNKMKAWFNTLKNIRRDGTYFWSNVHCTPKYDENKKLVAEMKKRYQQGGLGDVECKERLLEVLEKLLTPIRKKRKELMQDPDLVKKVLAEGTAKARLVAQKTIQEVKTAMRINYFNE